mgnify:CR=1 FL=1
MKDLTLVIPAKNESESLPYVLKELKKFKVKTLVVLEKKDFNTIESIKKFNCKILFQKSKGYGDALIFGIKNVKTKYFCIFNADGSFDPRELKKMHQKIRVNNFNLVFASRYMKKSGSEDDTIVTYFGNIIFSFLGKFLFSLPISDILYTYVLGETFKIKKINLKSKNFTFCVELPIKSLRAGLNLTTSPSYERKRIAGKKKVNALKDGYLILQEMVKLFFYIKK